MGSNPSGSKESKVLNVTHNSVSNLLTFYRQCLEDFAKAGNLSSKFQDKARIVVASVLCEYYFGRKKDGASSLTSSW